MDELDDYIKKQAASLSKGNLDKEAKDKIIRAAQLARSRGFDVPDDVTDDFFDLTSLESGRNHWADSKKSVVKRGVSTANGEQAIGFSQIMPSTAKKYQAKGLDPFREDDNIAMGLVEFYEGDRNDPIARRIAYVGGPNSDAVKEYRKTGKVSDAKLYSYLPKNKETFQSYVEGSGGFKKIDNYIKSGGNVSSDKDSSLDDYIQKSLADINKPPVSPTFPSTQTVKVDSNAIKSERDANLLKEWEIAKNAGNEKLAAEIQNQIQANKNVSNNPASTPPPAGQTEQIIAAPLPGDAYGEAKILDDVPGETPPVVQPQNPQIKGNQPNLVQNQPNLVQNQPNLVQPKKSQKSIQQIAPQQPVSPYQDLSVPVDSAQAPEGVDKGKYIFEKAARELGNQIYNRPLNSLEREALAEYQKQKKGAYVIDNKTNQPFDFGDLGKDPYANSNYQGNYTFFSETIPEYKAYLDQIQPQIEKTRNYALSNAIVSTLDLTPEQRADFLEMGFTNEEIENAFNGDDPRFEQARAQRENNRAVYQSEYGTYIQKGDSPRLAQLKALNYIGVVKKEKVDEEIKKEEESRARVKQSLENPGIWSEVKNFASQQFAKANPLGAIVSPLTALYVLPLQLPKEFQTLDAEEVRRRREKAVNDTLEAKKQEFGSFQDYEQFLKENEGAEYSFSRQAKEFGRNVARQILEIPKTLSIIDAFQEDKNNPLTAALNPLNLVLPENAKLSFRNAGNALDFLYSTITGKTPQGYVPEGAPQDQQRLFAMSKTLEKMLGEDRYLQQTILGGDVNSGVASALTFLAGGYAMKGIKYGSGILGALTQIGATFDDLKNKGVDEERARNWAVTLGLPLGFSEQWGLGSQPERILAKLGSELSDGAVTTLLRSFVDFAKSAARSGKREFAEEFLQEWGQSTFGQAAVNAISAKNATDAQKIKKFFDEIPQQAIESLPQAGLAGAIGFGTNVATETAVKSISSLLPTPKAENVNLDESELADIQAKDESGTTQDISPVAQDISKNTQDIKPETKQSSNFFHKKYGFVEKAADQLDARSGEIKVKTEKGEIVSIPESEAITIEAAEAPTAKGLSVEGAPKAETPKTESQTTAQASETIPDFSAEEEYFLEPGSKVKIKGKGTGKVSEIREDGKIVVDFNPRKAGGGIVFQSRGFFRRDQLLAEGEKSAPKTNGIGPKQSVQIIPQSAPAIKKIYQADPAAAPGDIVDFVAEDKSKNDEVWTEDDQPLDVTPMVIDDEDLITSFDVGFPEGMQPRDRANRVASDEQIRQYTKNLNPKRMDDNFLAGVGRPILVPVNIGGKTKYAALTANGRLTALRNIYDENNERAEAFRQLAAKKDEKAREMKRPIYGAVLNNARAYNLKELAALLNEGTTQMSAAEQAAVDADNLDSHALTLLEVGDAGNLNTEKNRPFFQKFFSEIVGGLEQNRFMTATGTLSQEGITRMRNAIFAKAFGGSNEGINALSKIAEDPDNNVKNIASGLLRVAGVIAKFKEFANEGHRYKELDISDDLARALEIFSNLREKGHAVEVFVNQQVLPGEKEESNIVKTLLLTFEEFKRSSRAIGQILTNYYAAANDALPNQASIFGPAEAPNALDLIQAAIETYDEGSHADIKKHSELFEKDVPEKQPENSQLGETEDSGEIDQQPAEPSGGLFADDQAGTSSSEPQPETEVTDQPTNEDLEKIFDEEVPPAEAEKPAEAVDNSKENTIVLVACGMTKLDRTAKAKDLYQGALFKKAREYAEREGGKWYILSARHELLDPETEIPPYEKSLNKMRERERSFWGLSVFNRLKSRVKPGNRIVILGGKYYFERLVYPLEQMGVKVEVPMKGLGIGEQLAYLDRENKKPVESSGTDAAHDAATSPLNDLPEPTEAQIEAGNYKKGHITINGLDISVENPKDSERKGVDRDGKAWSVKMQHHYGYIKRSIGADKENIDLFVKDATPEDFSGNVYIVDQIHPDNGKFDEHKVMLGFSSEEEAREAYLSNYADDWKGLKDITAMPFDEFKNWINSEQTGPVAENIEKTPHENLATIDLIEKYSIKPYKTAEELYSGEKTHLKEILQAVEDYDKAYHRQTEIRLEVAELNQKRSEAARGEKKAFDEKIKALKAESEMIGATIEAVQLAFYEDLLDELEELAAAKGFSVDEEMRGEMGEEILPYLVDGRYMEGAFNRLSLQELTDELLDEFFADRDIKPAKAEKTPHENPKPDTYISEEEIQPLQPGDEFKFTDGGEINIVLPQASSQNATKYLDREKGEIVEREFTQEELADLDIVSRAEQGKKSEELKELEQFPLSNKFYVFKNGKYERVAKARKVYSKPLSEIFPDLEFFTYHTGEKTSDLKVGDSYKPFAIVEAKTGLEVGRGNRWDDITGFLVDARHSKRKGELPPSLPSEAGPRYTYAQIREMVENHLKENEVSPRYTDEEAFVDQPSIFDAPQTVTPTVQTPGTRLKWTNLKEWIDAYREIKHRGPSGNTGVQEINHVKELLASAEAIIETETNLERLAELRHVVKSFSNQSTAEDIKAIRTKLYDSISRAENAQGKAVKPGETPEKLSLLQLRLKLEDARDDYTRLVRKLNEGDPNVDNRMAQYANDELSKAADEYSKAINSSTPEEIEAMDAEYQKKYGKNDAIAKEAEKPKTFDEPMPIDLADTLRNIKSNLDFATGAVKRHQKTLEKHLPFDKAKGYKARKNEIERDIAEAKSKLESRIVDAEKELKKVPSDFRHYDEAELVEFYIEQANALLGKTSTEETPAAIEQTKPESKTEEKPSESPKPENQFPTDLFGNPIEAKHQDTLFGKNELAEVAQSAAKSKEQTVKEAFGENFGDILNKFEQKTNIAPVAAKTAETIIRLRDTVKEKAQPAQDFLADVQAALEAVHDAEISGVPFEQYLKQGSFFDSVELTEAQEYIYNQITGGKNFADWFNKTIKEIEPGDQYITRDEVNENDTSGNSSANSENTSVSDGIREANIPASRRGSAKGPGRRGSVASETGTNSSDGSGLFGDSDSPEGTNGDSSLSSEESAISSAVSPDRNDGRSDLLSEEGSSDDNEPGSSERETNVSEPEISDEELIDLFDDLVPEKNPGKISGQNHPSKSTSAPQSQPKTQPKPADKLKDAASDTKKGIDATKKALGELFKPGKFQSSVFPGFDEKTYAAAKPHFIDAYNHFKDAASNAAEALKLLIADMRKDGYDDETLRNMKPYILQFAADLRDGKINTEEVSSEEETSTEDSRPADDSFEEDIKRQKEAELIPVELFDIDNIRETLPLLFDEQQKDVEFAENAFYKKNFNGVLFTNGTGTGKTFTGLGIGKRFQKEGKDNILLVAPAQEILNAWIQAGRLFNIEIKLLDDTNDNGKTGIVATTYANFQQNPALIKRKWDLVITDEAHKLSSNADGELTGAAQALRAVTLHKRGEYDYARQAAIKQIYEKAKLENLKNIVQEIPKGWTRLDQFTDSKGKPYYMLNNPRQGGSVEVNSLFLKEIQMLVGTGDDLARQMRGSRRLQELERQISDLSDEIDDIQTKARDEFKRRVKDETEKAKVVFLSATPFSYHKSIDYAEGYLFDFDEGKDPNNATRSTWGQPSNRELFYIEHLGYRMHYGKLTQPDANVDVGIMERQFNSWLKQRGSLSGRMLGIDYDYSRDFVLTEDTLGTKIDEGLAFLRKSPDGKYSPLYDIVKNRFDYHSRMYLLEALKAKAAVPIIKKHIALGRKVVVFHNFNLGGGFHPFLLNLQNQFVTIWRDGKNVDINLGELYDEFARERPDLIELDFSGLLAPKDLFARIFDGKSKESDGIQALFVNGTVKPKKRAQENINLFNLDNSGADLIVVQSDKGQAGISLHDTTGNHQRVLINLGLPVKPVAAIQTEGRIYRVGNKSDAIQLYFNTGTSWEQTAFARTIAERSSTAENLALGEEARMLKQSIIDSFNAPIENYEPNKNEGKGGKEKDRANQQLLSEWDKAKSFYFSNQKKNSRTKAQEGIDYFPTPEPIGLKMVGFADIKEGEEVLEPSAGHGAIARFFSETTRNTFIEPSNDLMGRLMMYAPGGSTNRFETDIFENLHVSNKYDAIVMNPPYGLGGATSTKHVEKAITHLKNGGRVVALLPEGPAADKKLDKLLYENPVAKDIYKVADISLPHATFERAGTKVKSHIVVLEKQTYKPDAEKISEVKKDFSSASTIKELFERIENFEIPARIEPSNIYQQIQAQMDDGTLQGKPVDIFPTKRDQLNQLAGLYIRQIQNPNVTPQAPEQPAAQGGVFSTGEFTHTRDGYTVYVAKLKEEVSREDYNNYLNTAKAFGGWYNRYGTKYKAIKGFAFKSAEQRQQFIQSFDESSGADLMSISESERNEKIFYSVLEQAIKDKMPSRAPMNQILDIARNDSKAEEYEYLKWAGFEEWLEEETRRRMNFAAIGMEGVKNNLQIPKEDVLNFIRENNVRLHEVIKEGKTDYSKDEVAQYLHDKNYDELEDWQKEDVDAEFEARQNGQTATDANEPKYSRAELNLPGGKNYRELLITLPENGRLKLEIQESYLTNKSYNGGLTDEEMEELRTIRKQLERIPTNFHSTHFGESNILVHIRFNERTDAKGNRVLFIEEIQSDWHQQGRKKGYELKDSEKTTLEKKVRELTPKAKAAIEANDDLGFDQPEEAMRAVLNHEDFADRWEFENESDKQILKEFREVYIRLNSAEIVPNAPFKKSWHELGIKRMLRYAVENGFDSIAWTTGDQQNERYALEKHIDRIEYRKSGLNADKYAVKIYDKKNGKVIDELWTEDKLEELVGKELSKRIVENATPQVKILDKLDLKVGGEGMKGFYDKILTSFVNKYVKKWGARVEPSDIETEKIQDSEDERFAAQKWREAHPELPESQNPYGPRTFSETVHSVKITPEMQESIYNSAQPLFSVAEEAKASYLRFVKTIPLVDLLPTVQIERNGSNIKGNVQAAELIRRALEQIDIDKGNLTPGDAQTRASFEGLFLEPGKLKAVVENLRSAYDAARVKKFTKADGIESLKNLADNLEEAARVGGRTAVFYILDEKLPQELYHQASYLGAVEKMLTKRYANPEKMDLHKAVHLADKHFFSRFKAYDVETIKRQNNLTETQAKKLRAAIIREETAAWIAEEAWEKLGVDFDTAMDYLLLSIESYADKNGNESLVKFKDVSKQVYEAVEKALETPRNSPERSTRQNNERGRGSSETQQSERPPGSSESKIPAGEKQSPGGSDAASRSNQSQPLNDGPKTTEHGKIKLASLPETERAAGIAVSDVTYSVFGDRAAQEAAQKIIQENGIEGTIRLLANIENPDVSHAIASFTIHKTLLDEAERVKKTNPDQYKNLIEKANQLAADHALKAVKAGRFIRAASIIQQSVASVLHTAQALFQQTHGKGELLPDSVMDRIKPAAELGEKAIAESETFKKTIEKLKRDIAGLKKALSGESSFRRASKATLAKRKRLVGQIKSKHQEEFQAAMERLRNRAFLQTSKQGEDIELMAIDGSSRSKGNGSYNYVIFDDQDVEINEVLYSIAEEAPTLAPEILEDLSTVGAMKLTEGLASPDSMFPKDFDDEMIAEFGEMVRPFIKQIHSQSVIKRDEWLKKIAKDKKIAEIKNEFDDTLTAEEIADILAEREAEFKKRAAIEKLHKIRAKDGKIRKTDRLEEIIAEVAPTTEVAVAAAIIAKDAPNATRFYELLKEATGKVSGDARETLRQAKDTLKRAKEQLAKENADLQSIIGEREKEVEEFEKLLSKANRQMRESQQLISKELHRISTGDYRYYLKEAYGVLNSFRSLQTAGELGFILRQGNWFALTHPKISWSSAKNIKRAFLQVDFDKLMKELEQHEYYQKAVDAGVEFAGLGRFDEQSLTKGEEEFRHNLFEKIPGLKQTVGKFIEKSESTMIAFLDSQRLLAFEAVARVYESDNLTPETHPKEFKALANYINNATGRATIGSDKWTNIVMNMPLFAGRFLLSRIKHLAMISLIGTWIIQPSHTRKVIAKDMLKYYLGMGAILSLGHIAGFVTLDWDDADFLKFKAGNQRFDVLGGLQQPLRYFLQFMASITREALGDKLPYGRNNVEGEFKNDMFGIPYGIPFKFVRSKLAPIPSLAVDRLLGKDFVGNEFSWGRALWTRAVPLFYHDLGSAIYNDGPVRGTVESLPGFIGIGGQNYTSPPEEPQTRAEKLASKINGMRFNETKAESEEEKALRDRIAGMLARARQGENIQAEVNQLYASGEITRRRAQSIMNNSDDSYFEQKIKRMPGVFLTEVRKVANDSERSVIDEILLRREKSANKKTKSSSNNSIIKPKIEAHEKPILPAPVIK